MPTTTNPEIKMTTQKNIENKAIIAKLAKSMLSGHQLEIGQILPVVDVRVGDEGSRGYTRFTNVKITPALYKQIQHHAATLRL